MTEKSVCKECGCACESCKQGYIDLWPRLEGGKSNADILHLHQEIESLKRKLMDRECYILQVETNVFKHAQQFPNGEWEHLNNELFSWKDKYDRLYESHKKMQKVNQGLEDKLLKLVDKFETEKASLNRDIADLTQRLVESRLAITDLEEQNMNYRSDCSIAMQLLQCKPSNFIAQKLSSFPTDLQDKVQMHFAHYRPKELRNSRSNYELRTIRVPIPTFPPTAMVYSVDNVPSSSSESEHSTNGASNAPDYVSAAIMAKVLEERTKERNGNGKTEQCQVSWMRRQSLQCKDKSTQTRWPSASMSCVCHSSVLAKNHERSLSGSSLSSGTDPNSQHTSCNGTESSTETMI